MNHNFPSLPYWLVVVFSARPSFLPPFCVPVSDASQVIYLFHLVLPSTSLLQCLLSCVWRCCSLCSLVIFLLSQYLNFCFAHCGYSHIYRESSCQPAYLQIQSVTVSLGSSPLVISCLNFAWKLPELVPSEVLLLLLLQKKNKKLKNSFCSLNWGFDWDANPGLRHESSQCCSSKCSFI